MPLLITSMAVAMPWKLLSVSKACTASHFNLLPGPGGMGTLKVADQTPRNVSPLASASGVVTVVTEPPPESYVVHAMLAEATPDGSPMVTWNVTEQGVEPSPETVSGTAFGPVMDGPSVSGRGVLVCVGVLVGNGVLVFVGVLVIVGMGVLIGVLIGVLVINGAGVSGGRQRFWKGS